jgi:predicted transcriptional regulator
MAGELDWQAIAIGALSVLSMLFGAVLKTLWAATQALAANVHQIEKALPETYMRRDDFRSHAERVEVLIQRLIDKLDGKADK